MLTDDELAAIREREEAATPGPWVVDREMHQRASWHYLVRTEYKPEAHPHSYRFLAWLNGGLGEGRVPRDDPETAVDAEFIAHAREDVPALLAEIERLQRRLAYAADALVDGRDTDLRRALLAQP